MKFARLIRTSALLFILVLPWLAVAWEVENPLYKHWASFKVGSSVTLEGAEYKSEWDFDGIPWTEIWTLKEITNEYVTVEEVSKSGTGGWTERSIKYYRTYDTGGGTIEDCGEEEIEVAGEKIKCRHYRIKNEGGYSMESNYWLSSDIPGEAKRSYIFAQEQSDGYTDGYMTAVSWEKK